MTALRITDIPIFAGNFLTSVKFKKKIFLELLKGNKDDVIFSENDVTVEKMTLQFN